MNFSGSDPKNDTKLNSGHAAPPSTPDQNKGPAQADQKGTDAKPGVQPTVKATSDDKTSGESMVSEGGHATPGKTPDAVREPDASIVTKSEPSKGSADGAADKPGLSA